MLNLDATYHRLEMSIVLARMSFLLFGLFVVSTAITFCAITRLAEKMNGKKENENCGSVGNTA